jgi:hypothetical protein
MAKQEKRDAGRMMQPDCNARPSARQTRHATSRLEFLLTIGYSATDPGAPHVCA